MRLREAGAAAAGALAALIGAAAAVGWCVGNMAWVRLDPALVPMQAGSALSLFLLGAGVLAAAGRRPRSAAVLGALGAAAGILPLPSGLPESMRAEPLSAVSAALAGAALLYSRASSRAAPRAVACAGALLAGFGLAAAWCQWGGWNAAFAFDGILRVPAGAAAGYASVGLGLAALPAPASGRLPARETLLPALAGLSAASAALCLWLALESEREARIRWTVAGAAEELSERLASAAEQGALEAAIREGKLFGGLLPGRAPRGYVVELLLGGRPVYSSAPPPGEGAPYARDVAVRAGATTWSLRLRPSAELLSAHASFLPRAVLGAGLLVAALLALALRLALLARRQAAEIEAQRALAQAASQAKSRFLGNVSRELRNPLNVILGFSDLLLNGQDGALTFEQSEDLRALRSGGSRLAGIAEQLLDLARLESGSAALERSRVPVEGLVRQVFSEFAPEARRKGLALEREGAAPSAEVLGDRARLRQALGSVMSNALKFTREGKVTLGLHEADGEVVILVRDTGPGLSEEEKRNLFEPFWQSRGLGGFKKAEGLGLGLHLAKRIVELHGGRVSAVGEPGKGSAFFLYLPKR